MTKVLLAEDNALLLESVAFELEIHGYEVIQAINGQVALTILNTSILPPDIIVSDIAMPDMDGFEFLKQVRSKPQLNGIPFLFMTAFTSGESVRTSRQLGADDYIIKPFLANDLVIAIENKLERVEAFRRAANRDLDEARQKLVNMMAHELRTPLTSIHSGTELLAEYLGDASDDLVQQMLGVIQNGSNRLHRLTIKALILLQIDSGHMKRTYALSSNQHNMDTIIAAAQNNVTADPELAKRHVTIKVKSDNSSAKIWGVSEYLVTMVEELLRNAIAFSPNNGEVWVEINQNETQIIVSIIDQGVGIAEKYLPLVWARFNQIGRDEYEQQGTGLGLAVVRESARIHGGDCTIESQLGHGTRVLLWLPRLE